jgi:hypothetical protein
MQNFKLPVAVEIGDALDDGDFPVFDGVLDSEGRMLHGGLGKERLFAWLFSVEAVDE